MSSASSRTLVCTNAAMVGMRLSALRLPLFAGGEFFRGRGGETELGREDASRERISTSSLPSLTRQSMRGSGLPRIAALFDSLRVSIDHRVKPGGDGGKNGAARSSLRAQRSNPVACAGSWIASSLSLLAMTSMIRCGECAERSDERTDKPGRS
jgi:hypothetical protein